MSDLGALGRRRKKPNAADGGEEKKEDDAPNNKRVAEVKIKKDMLAMDLTST